MCGTADTMPNGPKEVIHMSKKKIATIIFVICLLLAGGGTAGIIRYRKHMYAESLREKQQAKREEREEERKENIKNGVEATKTYNIPSFEGMTLEEARAKIKDMGITSYLETVEEVDSDMDKGLIVEATPKPGTSFYEDSTIHFVFYISKGKSD